VPTRPDQRDSRVDPCDAGCHATPVFRVLGLILSALVSSAASAQSATELRAKIRKAQDAYDLPTFYDLSRRFLKEFSDHRAVDTVRYEFAAQLVAENLKTPDSPLAKEAIALLREASLDAKSENARFDAALMLLKFEPTTDPGKAAAAALARFPKHPENGEIYAWAIAELDRLHKLDAAARWAKLLLQKEPKSPLADRCTRLIRRAEIHGKPAPLSGKEKAVIDKLGGRIVLVDFFATWCVPCVQSIPELVDLFKRREQHGLRILGIAMDDDRDKLIAFKQKAGVPWPFIPASFDGDVDERFGVLELPSYVIIDAKTGAILESELVGAALVARLNALLDAR
jgi:thiol-disulfide isomerase/thioredoxin